MSYQLFANKEVADLLAFLRENSDKLSRQQAREVECCSGTMMKSAKCPRMSLSNTGS